MTFITGVKLRRVSPLAVFAFAATTAVGIGGIGCSPSANAQTQQTRRPPRPLALKFGLRFPSDSGLKDEIGDVWFWSGLSYDVVQSRAVKPVVYQFYLDLTQRKPGPVGTGDGGFDRSTLTGRLIGIGPAAKFLLSPLTAHTQNYVGIGAGYYRVAVPTYGVIPGINFNGYGANGNQTEARVGGKLFAGSQGKDGFFVEADYTYVGEVGGTKPSGLGARIGYRF